MIWWYDALSDLFSVKVDTSPSYCVFVSRRPTAHPTTCNPDITYGLFRLQLKGHFFREAWTRRSLSSGMLRHRVTLTYLGLLNYRFFKLRSFRQTQSLYRFVKYCIRGVAVCNQSHYYGNSHATWNYTVLPAARHSGIPTFTPAKLVLDLATLGGIQGWVERLYVYPTEDSHPPGSSREICDEGTTWNRLLDDAVAYSSQELKEMLPEEVLSIAIRAYFWQPQKTKEKQNWSMLTSACCARQSEHIDIKRVA